MNKPMTLKDLMIGGHVGRNEIDAIARTLFDGVTTAAGPEGYIITSVSYDKLPPHVQGFIAKAILEFNVENILDAAEPFTIDANGEAECALQADDDEPF